MPGRAGTQRRSPPTPSAPTLLRLLSELPDAVIVIDDQGRVQWGNPTAESTFGLPLEAAHGLSSLDLVHPEDHEFVLRSLATVQGKQVGTSIEVRLRTPSGWRLFELIGRRIPWFSAGSILLSLRDLTDRRRFELSHDEDSRFRTLVQNAATLTMLLSADGSIQSCSGAMTRLLGHDAELVEGTSVLELVAESDRPHLQHALHRAAAGASTTNPVTVTVSLLRHDAVATVPFELSFVNLLDDPTVGGFVVSGHDVTERKRLEEQLSYLAFHDPLTGLGNRALLTDRLEQALARSARSGCRLALLFIDLDGFKQVNDKLGHTVGDQVLRVVGHRLAGCLRGSDTAARLGGDEFGVLVEELVSRRSVTALARRIIDTGNQPMHLEGGSVGVRLSIGITVGVAPSTVEELLRNADRAMYAAKRHGNQYELA